MLHKKKILCAAAATVLAVSTAAQAHDISFVIGENTAQINGETVSITPAHAVNNTTLAPLRLISEGLGLDAEWDNETITVNYENTEIVLTIGSTVATVNGVKKELPAAPEIIGDTAMVPIRFISEAFGANVNWEGETAMVTVTKAAAKLDNTKWQYNANDNVYWQVGIEYCANPVDTQYETLGVFVPGEYMTATDNGDGTYTCAVNTDGTKAGYTAATAPIVIPVNTPGYSAMSAPTGYVSGVSGYTNAGFVYVNAGCRGRNEGAPAGVTDLKAAIRYIRYSDIVGDTDRIFSFGMSGGGAQSALLGATGDSSLYDPYLEAIGAVMSESDAVAGSMCWCPITNLDYANEAYEWNMGVTRSDLSDEMRSLSDNMAAAFAKYQNELGLKDENGTVLTLTETEDGIYAAGTYYDYVKSEIERSLNNFLSDTAFPYTPQNNGKRGGGAMGGGRPDFGGQLPDVREETPNFEDLDGINRLDADTSSAESVTYQTPPEYIDSLNKDNRWIIYDSETNTARITSVEDFVKACKNAGKSVGSFDDLNASQGENVLFGYGDGNGAHFDPVMAELLADTEYGAAFAADLARTDALGNTVYYRMNMYNPMYYLNEYYDGYGTANVAKYWRIRTGINQSDTALSTEINLTLALRNYGREVDFETVWGQGHTQAERTGSSTDNFIAWVNDCLKEDSPAQETDHRNGDRGGRGDMGGGSAAETDPEILAALSEGSSKFEQFSFTDDAGITLEYSLYIPANYDENEKYPMIMFIPDASGSGKSAKEIVEQYYGASVWATEEEQSKHKAFVLVPAFSGTVVDDNWNTSDQIETAVNLINHLTESYSIDTDRLYTTGQSMGCMTSLYLNSKYPDMFAASLFVSGQWDISVLKPLEGKKFFYITAGGDAKASGGQTEVMAMFDADSIGYSYGEWNAQNTQEEQNAAVEALLGEGHNANMIRFEIGSVLNGGSGMEHMASFNYGYKIPAVRDWLFEQSK